MATISKSKENIKGYEFILEVKYITKNQRFVINVPELIYKVTGASQVTGSTQSEVMTEWNGVVSRFLRATEETRKVIAYNFRANAQVRSGNDLSVNRRDIFSEEGVVLGVWADVFLETKYSTSEDPEYRKEDNSLPQSMTINNDSGYWLMRNDSTHIIDWSPEREEFFRSLGVAMENLIVKLEGFMDDEKVLNRIVKSGKFPALMSGKE